MERHSPGPQAGSHSLHGHRACLFGRFSELLFDISLWLVELGRRRVSEIYRGRLGPTGLLHHFSDASNPCIYDLAVGDHYRDASAARAVRPPPKTWALYNADLVVCFDHWGDRLFHAVPMVSLDPFRGTQEALRIEDENPLGCHDGKIVFVLELVVLLILDFFG